MCLNVHGRTPLHSYALGNDSSVHGPLPNDIFRHCIGDPFDISKHVSAESINLTDNAGFTALHYAARRNPQTVERLAKAGANLTLTTPRGVSAFHIAAQSGKANVLGVLCSFLDGDQDTDGLDKAVNALSEEDGRGATPLMIACRQNHRVTAKYLIDHGADVLIQDEDGMTALHHLVDSQVVPSPLPVWKQLMATPGLVNITCKRGNTALHYAMINDYCPLARELIEAGADVWVTNLCGRNILHQFFADSIVWHHLDLLEHLAGMDGFQHALC
ncbi:hypothetical protein VHEMI04691 [[Torrubiella] hemipterigena]|uniref:Uncharacterized protein n=1 Tax=[Torrubiella] hemipterigena TaxID=1531966 RepID=A0A0A1SVZ5_9HYPO|nr:hypothetical protein VHEMI04691 [[Torrubiella] hemipterigena]